MAGVKCVNALTPILEYKRGEVNALKSKHSYSDLETRAQTQEPPRGFTAALGRVTASGQNGLICELKRKSPSAGDILLGANPIEVAKEYEIGGAACLSVLTDGPSFGGSLDDLTEIRSAISLPLLRKDFMIDTIQVAEARASGADAILVIMAAVDDGLARELCESAASLGMDALIEVHNIEELERALLLPSKLLGINNRDLTKMTTDLSVTEHLSAHVPPDRAIVSESGVKTPEDIERLRKAGALRFLIGESLMFSNDRPKMVSNLRNAGIN